MVSPALAFDVPAAPAWMTMRHASRMPGPVWMGVTHERSPGDAR
jgi:hypothetical protein